MNKLKALKRKEDTFVQRQISYGQDAIILSRAHGLGKKKKGRLGVFTGRAKACARSVHFIIGPNRQNLIHLMGLNSCPGPVHSHVK